MNLNIQDIENAYDNIERVNWIVFRTIKCLDNYYNGKQISREDVAISLNYAKEELSIEESIEDLLKYDSDAGIKLKDNYISKEYSKIDYRGIEPEKMEISKNIGKVLFDSRIYVYIKGTDGLCNYIESKFNKIGIKDYTLINEAYEKICIKYENDKASEISGKIRKIKRKPSIEELNNFISQENVNDIIKQKIIKNFGFND
jgi:hypothetical protein